MSAAADAAPSRRRNGRRLRIIAAVLAGNIHFVFVAFTSQPGCVAHLKEPGRDGSYRAAQSAC